MIEASEFLEPLEDAGHRFFTGVPCSFLTPLINAAIVHPRLRYVAAASEGEAVAIAAGAWLAGEETVVMCQNSGLGNAVNPLTSLCHPYRVPTLFITTWRGQPGLQDAPQHALMGKATQPLLDAMEVEHALFPENNDRVLPVLSSAVEHMRGRGLPFGLVMKKGDVRKQSATLPRFPDLTRHASEDQRGGGPLASRPKLLETVLKSVGEETAIIATTGFMGRALFSIADREQHFYQAGSMGCASAIGLGVALHRKAPVVVLDGDGAALMKLGALATIGAQQPKNLVHLLFDNGVHASTGGQATVSAGVDFAAIAAACGYRRSTWVDSTAGLEAALADALQAEGPTFVRVSMSTEGDDAKGRPTMPLPELARRFRRFVSGKDSRTPE